MPMDPRVSAGVACMVVRDGKVLMIRRQGKHASGMWALPGGWIDFGETPGDACLRELQEETGMDVSLAGAEFVLATSNVFEKEQIQSITLYHLMPNVKGVPTIKEPEKCSDMRWVDPAEALRPDALPGGLFPGLPRALATLVVLLRKGWLMGAVADGSQPLVKP